jgi:hypothetical protein
MKLFRIIYEVHSIRSLICVCRYTQQPLADASKGGWNFKHKSPEFMVQKLSGDYVLLRMCVCVCVCVCRIREYLPKIKCLLWLCTMPWTCVMGGADAKIFSLLISSLDKWLPASCSGRFIPAEIVSGTHCAEDRMTRRLKHWVVPPHMESEIFLLF